MTNKKSPPLRVVMKGKISYTDQNHFLYQAVKVKAVNDVCNAIFDRMGKNYDYFHQLQFVSAHILPATNQTQRWNSAVRSHLFELIIDRSRERETVVCYLRSAHLSTNNKAVFSYFKNSDFITLLLRNIM